MKFFFLSSHAHYALDPDSTRVSGGAELQVALLAKELSAICHNVVVAGGDTGQQDGRCLQGVMTRNAGRFHSRELLDTLLALPKVIALLAEYRPDFVVVLGWTAWLYILTLLRPILGYKQVFICGLDTEIDGSFSHSHGWRGDLFQRGVAKSDFRFAMSEYQRSLFRKLNLSCGLYRNLILQRKNPRSAEKDMDLLWVGRCQHIKRPDLFLDLVEKLPQARCEMICPCEDKELWNTIESRAQKYPNLKFRESIPYSNIQDHYDRARFLVSTSSAEGFPNVMIQAAQGGAGIISLALDPDGFIDTFSAGFCAGGDLKLFVAKTKQLLADAEYSERMGANAEIMINTWLDNQSNVSAFLNGLA